MTIGSVHVPSLASQRVVLEPLSPEHADGMFDLWSHPEVVRYAGPAHDVEGAPITLPAPARVESDKILEFWLRRREKGTGFRWAILLQPSQTFIGACGFNSLGRCAEYAYHLHPDHWGRGLMAEASRVALSWLSTRPGCDGSEVFIEPENIRSIRLAERLGFEPVGSSDDGTNRYVLDLKRLRHHPRVH